VSASNAQFMTRHQQFAVQQIGQAGDADGVGQQFGM
jgi:hypothetical protein